MSSIMDADAAVQRRKSSNRLLVDDGERSVPIDNSTVALSPTTLDELGVFVGDLVLLRGKRRRETVYYALPDDHCPEGRVRLNRIVHGNRRVRLGDIVTVHQPDGVPNGKAVQVTPFEDFVDGITGNLFDMYLKPYFGGGGLQPVCKGDRFVVHGNMHAVEFKVVMLEMTQK